MSPQSSPRAADTQRAVAHAADQAPPLGKDEIARIVDIQLKDLRKRLAERKLHLEVTPEAKAVLAERGYDPVFGARPLKRTIQRMIENPLAVEVLAGRLRGLVAGDARTRLTGRRRAQFDQLAAKRGIVEDGEEINARNAGEQDPKQRERAARPVP